MSVLNTTTAVAEPTSVAPVAPVSPAATASADQILPEPGYDLASEFAVDPDDLSVPGSSPERGLAAFESLWIQLRSRLGGIEEHWKDERGMSTIEYALGCIAAGALGALLYTVVTSDAVEQALTGIFQRALNQR